MTREQIVAELRALQAKAYGASADAENVADVLGYASGTFERTFSIRVSLENRARHLARKIDALIVRIEQRFVSEES